MEEGKISGFGQLGSVEADRVIDAKRLTKHELNPIDVRLESHT